MIRILLYPVFSFTIGSSVKFSIVPRGTIPRLGDEKIWQNFLRKYLRIVILLDSHTEVNGRIGADLVLGFHTWAWRDPFEGAHFVGPPAHTSMASGVTTPIWTVVTHTCSTIGKKEHKGQMVVE